MHVVDVYRSLIDIDEQKQLNSCAESMVRDIKETRNKERDRDLMTASAQDDDDRKRWDSCTLNMIQKPQGNHFSMHLLLLSKLLETIVISFWEFDTKYSKKNTEMICDSPHNSTTHWLQFLMQKTTTNNNERLQDSVSNNQRAANWLRVCTFWLTQRWRWRREGARAIYSQNKQGSKMSGAIGWKKRTETRPKNRVHRSRWLLSDWRLPTSTDSNSFTVKNKKK